MSPMISTAPSMWTRLTKSLSTTSGQCTSSSTPGQPNNYQYPWYTVKGPMAATIAYMAEWGWDVQHLMQWSRPENQFMLSNEIQMAEPWWWLEHLLYKEAQQQCTSRFAKKPNHQHLLTGLDWHTYRQLKGKLPQQQRRHLQTWVQGALHYRDADSTKLCPICNVPAYTVVV